MWISRFTLTWVAAAILAIALQAFPGQADDKAPDATIEVVHGQIALGASISSATGKLHYQGQTYEFEVGGIGIGGVGVSEVKSTGKVYNLTKVEDFYGLYGEMDATAALGDGSANITVENAKGVVVEIESDAEGLILSIGAKGVTVEEKS